MNGWLANNSYRLEKIAVEWSARLAASCMMLFLVVLSYSGWNLFDIATMMSSKWLLVLFFPYAIIYSAIADFICFRKGEKHFLLAVCCYIAGGYIPFFIAFGQHFYYYIITIFFAGTIGMICSFLYWGIVSWLKSYRRRTIWLAICSLLLVSFAVTHDFSVKKGMKEQRGEEHYEVSFSYFHGIHKIAIDLKEGETLHYSIAIPPKFEGGYGNYLTNSRNQQMSHESHEKHEAHEAGYSRGNGGGYSFTASRQDTYFIVVTGESFKGSFQINWSICS